MGPVSLSLHVRLPLGRVQRVHSSSSSYPVPCSLSRLARIHNFSCVVRLHENAAADEDDGSFFRRVLLGSRMKPGSCCRHTIVCHCSPWPYQAWEMLRSHSSSADHASSASSWQEVCGESMRNGGGLEVLAMALGFGVSLALAASSHVSVAGFLPLLSFVFFSTAVIILLQYTRKDVVKLQESHDLGTFGPSHLRVLQSNLVQLSSSLQATLQNWEDSITKLMETYQLPVMSISDGLIQIHSSVIQLLVLDKPVVHKQLLTLELKNKEDLSVLGFNSSAENLKEDIVELEDVSKPSRVNSNIEEVVTDLAKSVAQLAQAVASLEEKIENLEMTQFPSTRVVNSELIKMPEPDLENCGVSLVSEMSFKRITSSEPSISAEEDLLLPNALEFTSDVERMDTTTIPTGKLIGKSSKTRIATLGTYQAPKDSPAQGAIKFQDQITELRGDSQVHITNILIDTSAEGDGIASSSGNFVMIPERNLVVDKTTDIPHEIHIKEYEVQNASPALITTMRPNSLITTRHDDLSKCGNADPQVVVPLDFMAIDDKRNEQMVYAYDFNQDENSGGISRQASSLDSGSNHHEYNQLLFDRIQNSDKGSKQFEETRDDSLHTKGFRQQSNSVLQIEPQMERARVPTKSLVPLRGKQMEVGATQSGADLNKFMHTRNAANEQVRQLEEMHKEPVNGYVHTVRKYECTQDGSSYQSKTPRRMLSDKNLSSTSLRTQNGQISKHDVLFEDREIQALGGDRDFFSDADHVNYIGRDIQDIDVYKNDQNLAVLKSKELDDERFQNLLDEIEVLLNDGQEGLEGRIEVGVAERMLYEAADLCAKAITIRPSSLVAVGLWGNTLLLHGELKLRLSRDLQSMLLEPFSQSVVQRNSWEAAREKEGLEHALRKVCEECEELLVEAGRKFRLALSLDRMDMRALYNWGLALCHRAQLISEEGMKTSAQDADRVYLAAIDKFEAILGTSQEYAPGALLNWGLAMWDRSHLQPLGSKYHMKLLAQAKVIFKEALQFDPNYGPARDALVACTLELKELEEFEEPRKPRY
ncbi:unnamed protein product [Sphagnum tenellum]